MQCVTIPTSSRTKTTETKDFRMHELIQKISNSTPTLQGDAAQDIVLAMVGSEQYALVTSGLLEMNTVVEFANLFISSLAEIDIPDRGTFKSAQPIHVVKFASNQWIYMGVIYSNGAVVYTEPEDKMQSSILFVVVDKQLAVDHHLHAITIHPTPEVSEAQTTLGDVHT
jgi:hypothetical protein